ncbi:MAG: tryptophan-rich sensory protein [Ruminococcus sp.]|nr:tryptophan-rich sensory protein [Ruminococcus sp.]
MKKIRVTELLLFIVGTELVGALSSLLSGNFSAVIDSLNKPPLVPPAILFPIVWVILYALMGFSAYLVYVSEKNDDTRKSSLILYFVQLFVNFMWSIVFFRWKLINAAVAVIILLALLILIMIIRFRKSNPLAGYINIPYLIWVFFAAYLNIGFAVLN